MQVVPLSGSHVESAARLFTGARRQARTTVPSLGQPEDDEVAVATKLRAVLDNFPGVAVVQGASLSAFLTGFALPEFMGARRGAYCPEWAHGATGNGRAEMYRRMYAFLSSQWAEDGCYTHAVTLFAHDGEILAPWFRNGFGLNGVDAVRDLTPLKKIVTPTGWVIRKAGPDDADRLIPLMNDLQRRLAEGPVFLPLLEMEQVGDLRTWLSEPSHALWLAEHGREVVSYMQCEKARNAQRYVVAGEDGIAITGAYTHPAWRGRGVASQLLDRMIEWAREEGLSRCSVNFESQNIEANGFWLHHFTPVCYSVLRRVDERIAGVNREISSHPAR